MVARMEEEPTERKEGYLYKCMDKITFPWNDNKIWEAKLSPHWLLAGVDNNYMCYYAIILSNKCIFLSDTWYAIGNYTIIYGIPMYYCIF